MIRKILKRVRVNFRSSKSDRAAINSYRNYHKRIAKFFMRTPALGKKLNKYEN